MDGDDFQSMTNAIASLAMPSLAIVEGDVLGGGAELLVSCDFRLGVTGKYLKIPAAAVGLCYPVEGIQRMTQRLGSTLARKLMLTTESVSFEELAQHNAFDWLVPSAEIKAESEAVVQRSRSQECLLLNYILSFTIETLARLGVRCVMTALPFKRTAPGSQAVSKELPNL
jgi:enoyl-CoA hydratase/carnithine racemase